MNNDVKMSVKDSLELMKKLMSGETLTTEELMRLQRFD